MRCAGRAVSAGGPLPQPRGDGPARLRAGRVQVLSLPAARARRQAAHRALSAARARRQPLARRPGQRRALPRAARRVRQALSRGRAAPPDAVAAAVRRWRLQLPAPGPVRRAGVPPAAHHPAVGAGARFHRRRIRHDRAAPAHAVARRGGAARQRRRGGVRRAPSSDARKARRLPRQPAPRREPGALGPAPYPRHHLPRRGVGARIAVESAAFPRQRRVFNRPAVVSLIVQKFGGTSVGSVERIRNVARRVAKWKAAGHDLVVVPSAMAGETNRLISLAQSLQQQPDPRELDVVASTGEQVTIGLLSMALLELGVKARSYTGWQVKVLTDSAFTKSRIISIEDQSIRNDLKNGTVAVVAGFQGVDERGNLTTLGRGGSDTSAVALAAALKAEECQIYTDVDGVYTTDPRLVPEARRLRTITFEEMLEMAGAGSKVLQIRSVEFAGKYRVPTRVLSSLTDPALPVAEEAQSGTLITFEEDPHMAMEKAVISGVAVNRDEAKITVKDVPDRPGIAYAILGPIADAHIDVDVIVQNVGHDGMTDMTFTVHRNDYKKAAKILNEQVKPHIKCREVAGDERIAKVSIVGMGMRSHAGIAAQMFRTLAEEGINIQMISTSEIKITVVIEEKYTELAVRVLHKAFELEQA